MDQDSDEKSDSDFEEWPSAPPIDYLEQIKGYEMVSFDSMIVPPPASIVTDDVLEEGKDSQKIDIKLALAPELLNNLTQAKVREVLFLEVSKKFCYGKNVAKSMTIENIEYVPAFHYELQSFIEKRETSWSYASHKGGEVDGPLRGIAPTPWQIEENPNCFFKDEVRVVTVPHTGVVKACHKCRGTGDMVCRDCSGKGWVRCLHCHGDVYLSDGGSLGKERCYYCQHSKHGHGQQDCNKCQAKGKVNCGTCDGSAYIRCFIQLSITWKVITAEHIVEKLNMPEDLIRDVSGQVAFEEEKDRILPITSFDDETIRSASTLLVNKQNENCFDSRILRQRHQIRIVPVSKISYEWKTKKKSFFVYGYENKVYLPPKSYPQSCCWGCTIN